MGLIKTALVLGGGYAAANKLLNDHDRNKSSTPPAQQQPPNHPYYQNEQAFYGQYPLDPLSQHQGGHGVYNQYPPALEQRQYQAGQTPFQQSRSAPPQYQDSGEAQQLRSSSSCAQQGRVQGPAYGRDGRGSNSEKAPNRQ